MAGIIVLRMFGILPNMLELTVNACEQGCTYCYAKRWTKEFLTVDQMMNDILKKESKNNLTGFLIRHRSPITMSNRTDLMCLSNWKDYIKPLKSMGFPIYLETKLNKDYKDIPNYFNKNEDQIYITITGYGKKYEEKAFLSGEERIEASKWLVNKGFDICIGFNPYLPDKISLDEIKQIIKYVNPSSVVMREYHQTLTMRDRKYFMDEYNHNENIKAMREILKYCENNKIRYDINEMDGCLNVNRNLNDRVYSNNKFFGGNHFLYDKLVYYCHDQINEGYEIGLVDFDLLGEIYQKEFKYFENVVIEKFEVAGRNNRYEIYGSYFGIWDYWFYLWNYTKRLHFSLTEVEDMKYNNNKLWGRDKDDTYKI